jgi:hypothetical protein
MDGGEKEALLELLPGMEIIKQSLKGPKLKNFVSAVSAAGRMQT